MSVDEWFEQSEALRLLESNLRHNLLALADDLSEERRESILRVEKIIIRQCMQDHGVDFKEEVTETK